MSEQPTVKPEEHEKLLADRRVTNPTDELLDSLKGKPLTGVDGNEAHRVRKAKFGELRAKIDKVLEEAWTREHPQEPIVVANSLKSSGEPRP